MPHSVQKNQLAGQPASGGAKGRMQQQGRPKTVGSNYRCYLPQPQQHQKSNALKVSTQHKHRPQPKSQGQGVFTLQAGHQCDGSSQAWQQRNT